MTNIEEKLFDRFDQTFKIFKNNFLELFLPLFIYKLIAVVIFGSLLVSFFFSNIGDIAKGSFDFFSLLSNSYIVMSIIIGVVLFILYLMIYIPVFLGLIKSIKQAVEGEKITTKDNLVYGLNHLYKSFNTYWYIFSYMALIPSLIFISGGLLFNAGYYFEGYSILKQIGGGLMILGGILFIIFVIYRGVKATFPIYSAVNHDNFKKDDFINSINITDNQWWRIIGNMTLVGIIIGFAVSIVSNILKIFSYSGLDFGSIKSIDDILAMAGDVSAFSQIISGSLNNIFSTIGAVFIIIFTYLLFLRLKFEASSSNDGIAVINKEEL